MSLSSLIAAFPATCNVSLLSSILNEGREACDLVIQALSTFVVGLGMPVNASSSLRICSSVDSLDQRATCTQASRLRIDEQIFQIAVAIHRPRRQVKMIVDETDQMAAGFGDKPVQGSLWINQSLPGELRYFLRQMFAVEMEIARPELVPAAAVFDSWLTDVQVG